MADATQAGEVPADAVVETKQPTWRMPSPMPSMLSFYDTFYPLRMYNSLTRSKVPFIPKKGKAVSWYMCGPTVYDSAHMGHARTYVVFDILRRIMTDYFGYDVTLVMNITDIDDKIIERSAARGMTFSELSRTFEAEFMDDMKALGVLPPHAITRVSEYVPEVIAMIQDIMDRGFAYAAGGSVYFDVPAFSATSTSGHAYGKLVPENVGNSAALEEGEGRLSQSSGLKDKRDSSDFALWKASKEGEPAWPSPWGPGRPGWHIECSAMATAVLKDLTGGSMDIHSGGVDLRFPHHDNELAQAEAALGIGQWVNYFVHSGHLNIDGLKMSKSLKNFIKIGEALKKFSARSLRLLFLMHKYNAPMDYSGESMEQVEALDRLFSSFFDNVKVQLRALQGGAAGLGAASQHYGPRELAALSGLAAAQADLHAALCDDFDTPTAMRVLQRVVRDTNKYMSEGTSVPTVLHNAAAFVTRTFKLFGLIAPQRPIGHVATGASTSKEELLTPYLDALAAFRSTVREAAKAKDTGAILAACDALRDEVLPPLGVQLEDAGATSAAAAAAGGSGGASGAAVAAPAIWKLGDPAELLKERDAKQAAAAAKAAAKAAEKERLAKEQAEKARVAAMTPAQFMASLTVPDGTDPMYTQFGEDGLPTADAAGEPLTKAGAKKAAKLFKNHQKTHAKWLKAQES